MMPPQFLHLFLKDFRKRRKTQQKIGVIGVIVGHVPVQDAKMLEGAGVCCGRGSERGCGMAARAAPAGRGLIYEERGGCADSTAALVNKAARGGAR